MPKVPGLMRNKLRGKYEEEVGRQGDLRVIDYFEVGRGLTSSEGEKRLT
jgi:hypothetical protein